MTTVHSVIAMLHCSLSLSLSFSHTLHLNKHRMRILPRVILQNTLSLPPSLYPGICLVGIFVFRFFFLSFSLFFLLLCAIHKMLRRINPTNTLQTCAGLNSLRL